MPPDRLRNAFAYQEGQRGTSAKKFDHFRPSKMDALPHGS